MSLGWREGLFACEADGRTILLDVTSGRYSSVSDPVSRALSGACSGQPLAAADRATLHPLIERGLLTFAADQTMVAVPRRPTSSWTGSQKRQVPIPVVCMALLVRLLARLTVRGLRFPATYRLTRAISLRAPCSGRRGDDTVSLLAAALARTDLVFRRGGHCMERSLSLKLMATLCGLHVEMVVGVRGSPFQAHCWIEREGCVLSDDLGDVAAFTPLLSF